MKEILNILSFLNQYQRISSQEIDMWINMEYSAQDRDELHVRLRQARTDYPVLEQVETVMKEKMAYERAVATIEEPTTIYDPIAETIKATFSDIELELFHEFPQEQMVGDVIYDKFSADPNYFTVQRLTAGLIETNVKEF
jgi:hypothetical protein